MAGRRQHYIPQFLQRGFLADGLQGGERTWLHRRATEAKLVGIRDVGVQEYFYSKLSADGESTLDDLITAMEGGLDAELDAFRRAPAEAILDPKTAARLITHLILRTAHVRSVFQQGMTQILDQVVGVVSDSRRLRDFVGLDRWDQAGISAQIIDEALKLLPQDSPCPPAFAERVIAFWIRESFDEFHRASEPTITKAVLDFTKALAPMTRDGHNKALMTADQSLWEAELSLLYWRTHAVAGAILPDCVALARDAAGLYTPLLLRDQQSVDLVILPIAHDRLLIGSSRERVDVDVRVINGAGAACSDSFFISRQAGDGEGLASHIGQRCAEAIGAVVQDALKESPRLTPLHNRDAEANWPVFEPQTSESFTFSLSCKDFADANTAARLGRILQVVVQEMAREMPLSRLDGMTFAIDYLAALEAVNRGEAAVGIGGSRPCNYGRSVAKCLNVLRSAERKDHIVFDADIANGLLSEDDDARALALHTVVSMLGHVAFGTLYEAQMEALAQEPTSRIIERFQPAVTSAPSRYFVARASAFCDAKAGERYSELVTRSLSCALDAIREARLAYRMDNDLEGLLNTAVQHFSPVLSHAADWLGHRDGLPEQDSFSGSSLPSCLKAYGLNQWLELFGHDLRRLHDVDRGWTSASVLALGRHVERLLWTTQICPWPMPDGGLYVSVPMGNDEELLADRARHQRQPEGSLES